MKGRLSWALGLNAAIIFAEFTGGLLIGSVGLMSDAWHNLIDQGHLFLTLYAHILAGRPANGRRTFGYHRVGIVAAFVNAALLILVSVGLAALAARRLSSPVTVPGGAVMGIAIFSFAANLGIALLLQKDAHHDLNIRSAFWHMLGDAWVSMGVVLGGLAIKLSGRSWIDPAVSLLVVCAMLKGAWPIFIESLDVLLESAPRTLDVPKIAASILRFEGVRNMHDVHLWEITPGISFLTCHVLVDSAKVGDEELQKNIRKYLASDFGLKHLTIQMESACCHPDSLHCDLERLQADHAAGSR